MEKMEKNVEEILYPLRTEIKKESCEERIIILKNIIGCRSIYPSTIFGIRVSENFKDSREFSLILLDIFSEMQDDIYNLIQENDKLKDKIEKLEYRVESLEDWKNN